MLWALLGNLDLSHSEGSNTQRVCTADQSGVADVHVKSGQLHCKPMLNHILGKGNISSH